MASNVVETLIGAAVLCAAGGFMYYAAANSDLGTGGSSYELSAKFFEASGIGIGGDVRLSGVKIGSVRDVTLDKQTYEALVLLNIDNDVRLPSDSSAKIASDGLLGGSYLAIEPGASEYMLDPGEDIEHTQGSVSIMDLIGKAIYSSGGNSE